MTPSSLASPRTCLRSRLAALLLLALPLAAACDSDSEDKTDGPAVQPDATAPSASDGGVDREPVADAAVDHALADSDGPQPDAFVQSALAAPWDWSSVASDVDGGTPPVTAHGAFVFGAPDKLYLQGTGRGGLLPGKTADELAFASQARTGDVELQALIRPTGSCKERESKIGAMLRQDLSTSSAYVAATITGASIERVQYRAAAGAAARVAAEFDRTVDPIWVRLVRRGSTIDAWMSGDGDHWWTQQFTMPWSDPYRVGLFVSSKSATDCDAVFEHVRVRTPLPEPWLQTDVGTNDTTGAAQYASGTFVIDGSGSDIEDQHDRFFFARQPAHGDLQITARIVRFDGGPHSRGGVMLRASSIPDAPMASVLLTSEGQLLFLVRSDWGANSAEAAKAVDAPSPVRVGLVRTGDTFAAFYAADGQPWTLIGTKSAKPPVDAVDVGLAVSAGDSGARAQIDGVEVTATPSLGK